MFEVLTECQAHPLRRSKFQSEACSTQQSWDFWCEKSSNPLQSGCCHVCWLKCEEGGAKVQTLLIVPDMIQYIEVNTVDGLDLISLYHFKLKEKKKTIIKTKFNQCKTVVSHVEM